MSGAEVRRVGRWGCRWEVRRAGVAVCRVWRLRVACELAGVLA